MNSLINILKIIGITIYNKPLMLSVGFFVFLGLIANPCYAKAKTFFSDSEFILIANEFLLLILFYLTTVKNIIITAKEKHGLKTQIATELPEILNKLHAFSVNIDVLPRFEIDATNDLFFQWQRENKKFINISPQFINLFVESHFGNLDQGYNLFVKYLLFDLFPIARNKFIIELSGIDSKPGSAKYEFCQYYAYITNNKVKAIPEKSRLPNLSENSTDLIWKRITDGNIEYYIKKVSNKSNQEALISVAESCIKNGYTSFEEILNLRNNNQPFKMLIKYDERLAYLETNIKALLLKSKKKTEAQTVEIIKEVERLKKPQPFSASLYLYDDAIIQLLPKDPFLYVIDLEKMKYKYKKKTADKFMLDVIVPRAKKNHDQMIKEIRKLDSLLADFSVDFAANYYIVDMDVESLIIKADSKSIPEGFRKLVVRDLLDNGNLPTLLSKQDMYIGQVISTMPIEGLLFNSGLDSFLEKYFTKYKNEIKKNFKQKDISYKTLQDKAKFDKEIKTKTEILFIIFSKDLNFPPITRKHIQIALKTVASNSKQLLTILKDR